MKNKTKQTLKTILLSALGIGAVVGVCAGVNALVDKNDDELKTIYPTFSIGGLNEKDGKYEDSKLTLYTKNAFECNGLTIKPNFDSKVNYQIFFYDEIGTFISSTEVLEGSYKTDIPSFATHARLELTPIWADDVKDKDKELKWYNYINYTNELEIKVSKDQDKETLNIVSDNLFGYQGLGTFSSGNFNADETSTTMVSAVADVTAYDRLLITIPKTMYLGKTCQIHGREGTNGNITINYNYWNKVEDMKIDSDSVTFIFEIGDSKSFVITESVETTSIEAFKNIEVYGLE